MGQVSGHTGSVDNIEESKLLDQRANFEEEREGLCARVVLVYHSAICVLQEVRSPGQCRQRHREQLRYYQRCDLDGVTDVFRKADLPALTIVIVVEEGMKTRGI